MRVVIEGITGDDLVLLYLVLKKLEFENKPELIRLMNRWANETVSKE